MDSIAKLRGTGPRGYHAMPESDISISSSYSAGLVADAYRKQFGEFSGIFRAPGRVNLIGEHTDYNDGFVMPCALGLYTYVVAGRRNDQLLKLHSLDFGETIEFPMAEPPEGPTGHWSDYVRGVAATLRMQGITLPGANLVIKGEVPIGAGLSSSAAIEVATAFALLRVARATLSRRQIAFVCQRAEHEFAGTQCGIMDQFISCFGQARHALLLDCRSLDYKTVEIPTDVSIVVCNTMVRHELAGGEYNLRRADCEAGARLLQQTLPNVRALRDISPEQLQGLRDRMPTQVYRRCRHVVTEDERTLRAADALSRSDVASFGQLMYESHASLRDDYEVSCRELDLMVGVARQCDGVFGVRMTGGGFGGCTVNLVDSAAVTDFRSKVSQQYQEATGIMPDIYVCTSADGASEVPEPAA